MKEMKEMNKTKKDSKSVIKIKIKKGQTKDTPDEKDGLRVYYTSLMNQKFSPMAIKWCLERGLVPDKKIDEYMLLLNMNKLNIKNININK